MITASEARELAGPSTEEHLAIIEQHITKAAKNKKRLVIIRDNPYAAWLYGSDMPDIAKAVLKELDSNGFKISLHYQENQFVDMGLKIEW
jgi:hypothetical protein